jgi:hypothetical protein
MFRRLAKTPNTPQISQPPTPPGIYLGLFQLPLLLTLLSLTLTRA